MGDDVFIMKVIAINGSPRKNWNTDTLLQKAIEGAKSNGADTEIIYLYDLNFKGCTSCLNCKIKDNKYLGHCAMEDDLTEVLEKILKCDVLFLGSPIYFGNVTGEMRSFLERLLFSNILYNLGEKSVFKGKISSAFIYTMNVPTEVMKNSNYEAIFHFYERILQILKGPSEYMISTDTYQFDDYSKYETSMFEEDHKARVKEKQFPIDCNKAFELGVKLTTVN